MVDGRNRPEMELVVRVRPRVKPLLLKLGVALAISFAGFLVYHLRSRSRPPAPPPASSGLSLALVPLSLICYQDSIFHTFMLSKLDFFMYLFIHWWYFILFFPAAGGKPSGGLKEELRIRKNVRIFFIIDALKKKKAGGWEGREEWRFEIMREYRD